jgi:leader peptidase (prepilin peptidase) / N-methyltransferase
MDILEFFSTNHLILLIVVAIFSILIGSFLNVVIYRLPRMMEQNWHEECRIYLGLRPNPEAEKLNLYLPFSHCPHCKKLIKPWHNIPVLSFLWLKGKCIHCHAPISLHYPLVEAITCILSVYVVWKFGLSLQSVFALLFTWIIICLSFIDLDYQLLPDQLTLLLLWLGLLASLFNLFCPSSSAIIGAIAGYVIFGLTQWAFGVITKKTGMGQGDFKFLAALGAYLGWEMLPLIILLSSIIGIIFALTHMAIKKQFKSVPLPFGPYLAIAGWIALLWGSEIMHYYFEVF